MTETVSACAYCGTRPLFPHSPFCGRPSRHLEPLESIISAEPIMPDPIPRLAEIPTRVESFPISAGLYDDSPIIDAIQAKVRAEDERMRRLLPPAPRGMHWTVELRTHDAVFDFNEDSASVMAKLVYRLEPLP